jgi:aminoglycoside phosphotransferase (APT) family kinase protein
MSNTEDKFLSSSSPSTRYIDRAKEVREGEALDLDRLEAYLARELPELDGPFSVQQFPSGHSNLTYLVRCPERELVLRRPPLGMQIKTAHDMGREFRILSGLQQAYDKIPRPLVYCEDASVLGAPFYLMERVSGIIFRHPRPPEGLSLSAALMRELSTALIDNLAALHTVDLSATGLAREGQPTGYVERQVTGWSKRYFNAKTNEIPEVEEVAAWLAKTIPSESAEALIHGDYKYDNLVLDPESPSRIIAVLDWEMATVGDPLMDLGTTLGYWLDPSDPPAHRMLPLGPTLLPGNLTRRQLVERYAEVSGMETIPEMLFYYVFGLFKIVVIAQQIYKRFKEGHTQDQRFASMIHGVRTISTTAARAIEVHRIHNLS